MKKSIYLPIIALVVVASTVGITYVYSQPNDTKVTEIETFYTASPIPVDIIMKPGETQVIPVDIMGPKEKSLNMKVGVTSVGHEPQLVLQDEQILPMGISVALGKKSYDLPATSEQGFAKRDINTITISVGTNTKAGDYPLSFVLYTQDSVRSANDVRQHFTIHVQ